MCVRIGLSSIFPYTILPGRISFHHACTSTAREALLDTFSYSISYLPSLNRSSSSTKSNPLFLLPLLLCINIPSPPPQSIPVQLLCELLATGIPVCYFPPACPSVLLSPSRRTPDLFPSPLLLFRNRPESIRRPRLNRQRLQHGRRSQRCATP